MAVKVTYYGHSAFSLEADDTQVIVDPFLTGNPVCTTAADEVSPATILITHAHNDHVGDTVSIAQRAGATVITTVELSSVLGKKGVNKVIGANFGGTVAFEGGTVKFVPAWHSSTFTDDDGSVVAPGIPAGLVVRFGGQTIYFAGDTCLFGDMKLIGEEELDIAVLPIGDHFTMGPNDALRAVKMLNPKAVIPCHYNTFPPIRQDGAAWVSRVEEETSATGILMEPGETAEIE